jgi:hypothetical protein
VFQDLRLGLRILAKNPGSTLVATLILALAIGVNTAIFSVLNAALLKFLPVHNPGELVTLTDPNASMVLGGLLTGDRSLLTYTEFVTLRDRVTRLSGLCASQMALQHWPVRISHGAPERVHGRLVSENYFTVFGVEPARGRFFTHHDAAGIGQDPYAVISYDYWQRRFGGDPSVLGTPIHLHQATLTIIGIAPQGFHGETVGQNPEIWAPMLMQPLVMPGVNGLSEYFEAHDKLMWLHAFGRRRNANMRSINASLSGPCMPACFMAAPNFPNNGPFSPHWPVLFSSSPARTLPTCCSPARPHALVK